MQLPREACNKSMGPRTAGASATAGQMMKANDLISQLKNNSLMISKIHIVVVFQITTNGPYY